MSEIRKAGPRDYPMLIGLSGPGGSGKTYSALLLAKHLAGGKPIGMIDTEDGRGERYYRQFDYLYLQLTAPYSPEAYVKAMDEMRAAGVAAMVVDSASHEWEGEGGCLEIHHEVTGGRDAQNMIGWAKVKPRHRKFIGYAKSTGIHTILCFQAREKSKPNPDRNAPAHAKIINLGWQPVSNASDAFEFTLSGMFQPGGEGTLTEDPAMVKTFVDFREVWKPGMKITPAICQKLVALHRQACAKDAEHKPVTIQSPANKPIAPEIDLSGAEPGVAEAVAAQAPIATKPRSLADKIKELEATEDMALVIAAEDGLAANRGRLKEDQAVALEAAIENAKRRLDPSLPTRADRYAARLAAPGADLDQLGRQIAADPILQAAEVEQLLQMVADARKEAA